MFYLVTGGAGFIGSNLTEALLSAGHRVRVLDNFLTGKRANIAGLAGRFGDSFELMEGDLRNLAATRKATDGVEYILHQGALPSVPRSVADPVLSNEINVGGTVNLLLAARDAGPRRAPPDRPVATAGCAGRALRRRRCRPRDGGRRSW